MVDSKRFQSRPPPFDRTSYITHLVDSVAYVLLISLCEIRCTQSDDHL